MKKVLARTRSFSLQYYKYAVLSVEQLERRALTTEQLIRIQAKRNTEGPAEVTFNLPSYIVQCINVDIYLKFFNKPVEHLDDVCWRTQQTICAVTAGYQPQKHHCSRRKHRRHG